MRFRTALTALAAATALNVGASEFGTYTEACKFEQGFHIQPYGGDSRTDAKYLGVFEGKWAGKLGHNLIVYKIETDGTTRGFYAHPAFAEWEIKRPGCWPIDAFVRTGKLEVTLGNGARVTYEFVEGDSKRRGTYSLRGRDTPGEFVRVRNAP